MTLIIDTPAAMARALDQPLDPDLRRLLTLRRDQMAGDGNVRFIVVEASDTTASLQAAIAYPLSLDDQPQWEWVERHGDIIEVAFIFGEAADVLIVPDNQDTDADLIRILNLYAAAELDRDSTTAR